MMDAKEEGECSGSDFEEAVYNPIIRPDASLYRNNVQPAAISDDDSSPSEDSDSDGYCMPKKKKRPQMPAMDVNQRNGADADASTKGRKKNNIWANVLEEDGLMQNIHGVGLKKIISDRNVESYDYTRAIALRNQFEDSDPEDENDVKKGVDERGGIQKRLTEAQVDRKRKREKYKKEKPRLLKDIKADVADLASTLAEALSETKADILVRCVEVLGRNKSLNIYKETQKIEREGGIMVMNGSRRRTSGGVYFLILKTFEGVTKEETDQIFVDDKTSNLVRKRKRANRRRKQTLGENSHIPEEDGLHLRGLFSDDPGGTKCPGSTPVTSPQDSASDDEGKRLSGFQSPPLPLKEVIERAAIEIEERDSRGSPEVSTQHHQEDMEIV